MTRRPQLPTLFPYPTLFRPPALEHRLERAARFQRPGEPLGAAGARDEPEGDLGQADARVLASGHEAHIAGQGELAADRKSTRLNSRPRSSSYAGFCSKKYIK